MELSPFGHISLLLISFLILRAIYNAPRSNAKMPEKIRVSPVETWMTQEVGVAQNVLIALRSSGICVNSDHIPLCIKDILLSGAKSLDGHDPRLLKLLKSSSRHGTLGNHLQNEAKKKKQRIILIEWLRQNNLLTSMIKDQLQENEISSLGELLRFYAYWINSYLQGNVENINKVR